MTSRYTFRDIPPGTTFIVSPEQGSDPLTHRSDNLRVVFNRVTGGLLEKSAHFHTQSTEVYLVTVGELILEIEGDQVKLRDHQSCTIPPGVPHRIAGSSPTVEAVVIRAPAAADRVTVGGED
jgi:mannose-6-phosphate isomerase-like protein (cupin superfamily)